eukprot:comp21872_c0_seq1/m.31288 comp21872_c0_seq1/g.31288  ORF comp21872_c0_seq1/g.31288 comp21872_c0_seq1/m.31288 type:complete len:1149 (-) comp21872_c0_seq1:208-3654(-)
MDASLKGSPQPLVFFMGLHSDGVTPNLDGSSVGDTVWRGFNVNAEPTKARLNYRSVHMNYRFPPRKGKKDYDHYQPAGILKNNWIYKHLHVLPAVTVVFFELEWDDPRWDERQNECSTALSNIRKGVQGRDTKLVVVLIQQSATPKDEAQTESRAISFRRACEVEGKNSLFILPLDSTDPKDLRVYILRLEGVFRELAQQYYEDCARRVKSHRTELNANAQHMLLVRHQFKLGFFAEMNGNNTDALKHYNSSYTNLFSIRNRADRAYEVKTVAGFINFKACKLLFQVNVWKAIEQFRKHMGHFKEPPPGLEAALLHWSWASRQYQVFADAFADSLDQGTVAGDQTHHPGIYYHQAALDLIRRYAAFQALATLGGDPHNGTSLTPNQLMRIKSINRDGAEVTDIEYMGQLPNPAAVDPSVTSMDGRENDEPLSQIIELFTLARKQYKQFKSVRMTRYIAVQIADQYRLAGYHERALMVYDKIQADYRSERWPMLVDSVVWSALLCAIHLTDIASVIRYAFETSCTLFTTSPEERAAAQEIFDSVVQSEMPLVTIGGDLGAAVAAAAMQWNLRTEPVHVTIDMLEAMPSVHVLVRFTNTTFTVDQPLVLEIAVKSLMSLPVRFAQLHITFSEPSYDTMCMVVDDGEIVASQSGQDWDTVDLQCGSDGGAQRASLGLDAGQMRVYRFHFMSKASGDSILEVKQVALHLGGEERSATLNWAKPKLGTTTFADCRGVTSHLPRQWAENPQLWSIRLMPRAPQVTLWLENVVGVKDTPGIQLPGDDVASDTGLTMDGTESFGYAVALVGERCPVSLKIVSKEEEALRDVKLSLDLIFPAPTDSNIGTVSLSSTREEGESVQVPAGSLSDVMPLGVAKVPIFIDGCTVPGQRILNTKVTYRLGEGVVCSKEQAFAVDVMDPLLWSAEVTDLQFRQINMGQEAIQVHSPFLLNVSLTCTAPQPLDLLSCQLDLAPGVAVHGDPILPEQGLITPGDAVSSCVPLVVSTPMAPGTSLGYLNVTWKRAGSVSQGGLCRFPLPAATVVAQPFVIEARIPPYGQLNRPVGVQYVISNQTNTVQQVALTTEPSDSFMFSGYKSLHVRLMPRSAHTHTYSLFPLACGRLALPRLSIRLASNDTEINTAHCPSFIYIRPAESPS